MLGQRTQGGQLQGKVLQGVSRLVDNQHIQHNVILVHVHIGLRIHRVREACQLSHLHAYNQLILKFNIPSIAQGYLTMKQTYKILHHQFETHVIKSQAES